MGSFCAGLDYQLVLFADRWQGIPTVERAVINQDKGKYNLLVEGYVLLSLLIYNHWSLYEIVSFELVL